MKNISNKNAMAIEHELRKIYVKVPATTKCNCYVCKNHKRIRQHIKGIRMLLSPPLVKIKNGCLTTHAFKKAADARKNFWISKQKKGATK